VTESERQMLLLYAELPAFKRKVAVAQEVIAEALALRPERGPFYIAYSGGSDSLVVLDMVRQSKAGRALDVLTGDDGADFPETLHFLAETEARYGLRLKRIRSLDPWRDWCLEMGRPDLAEAPDTPGAWMNPPGWDATWRSLTKDAPLHGYGGVLLGLLGRRRKEGGESSTRWRILHGGNRPLYQVASERNIWHCSPLALWTKRDVWAYIASRKLAYNPVYDKLAELGIPLEQRRVAPLTCFRTLHYGSVVALRSGWPSLFNQLAATFPAVRAYT
jgi:phosphoadenosine phosphosulfate reductase